MSTDTQAELINRLAAGPDRARKAALAAAGKVTPPGEWPPNLVIGHLAYVEGDVWRTRFKQMAVEENPFWQYWEPDGINWQGLYGARPLDELLEEFDAARQETVAYLRSLPAEGWQRHGTHSKWGQVDVAYLCGQILDHDAAHLCQIENPS